MPYTKQNYNNFSSFSKLAKAISWDFTSSFFSVSFYKGVCFCQEIKVPFCLSLHVIHFYCSLQFQIQSSVANFFSLTLSIFLASTCVSTIAHSQLIRLYFDFGHLRIERWQANNVFLSLSSLNIRPVILNPLKWSQTSLWLSKNNSSWLTLFTLKPRSTEACPWDRVRLSYKLSKGNHIYHFQEGTYVETGQGVLSW